jgi:hypothetical protein
VAFFFRHPDEEIQQVEVSALTLFDRVSRDSASLIRAR